MKIIVIYGATAVGKSKLALSLAQQHGRGVIINSDALQQYRDLPILSAQPSDDDKKNHDHRLYGFLSASEKTDVATWCARATKETDSVLAEGKIPIIVGGSGLYIESFLQGLSLLPAVPNHVSQKLHDDLMDNPSLLKDYHQELLRCDPATNITANDRVRIIRSLAVFRHSGMPLSVWHRNKGRGFITNNPSVKIDYHYLTLPRNILLQRISYRTQQILTTAIAEYQQLLQKLSDQEKNNPSLAINKTIGAVAISQYIKGEIDRQDLEKTIILKTRQYAKRQETWYRGRLQKYFMAH